MSVNTQNFVNATDKVLKEGWLKKRNFKGEVLKNYSKRWVILTDRYIDWYDHPGGARKDTVPLQQAYCRIHEATGFIVGDYSVQKEWLFRDEGATPAATAGEWVSAINSAIENYRNIPGSTAATGGQKGLVQVAETEQITLNSPVAPVAPAPTPVYASPVATVSPVLPVANVTAAPIYTPPVYNPPRATYIAPTATYITPAPMATYVTHPAPVVYAPTATVMAPAPMYAPPPVVYGAPTVTVVQPTYTTYGPMY